MTRNVSLLLKFSTRVLDKHQVAVTNQPKKNIETKLPSSHLKRRHPIRHLPKLKLILHKRLHHSLRDHLDILRPQQTIIRRISRLGSHFGQQTGKVRFGFGMREWIGGWWRRGCGGSGGDSARGRSKSRSEGTRHGWIVGDRSAGTIRKRTKRLSRGP